jgi:hypothetical protein
MRSIQTSFAFPLSSVKPLDGLRVYRDFCLSQTKKAIKPGLREQCPACDGVLQPAGSVDGLEYARCSGCASLLLHSSVDSEKWPDVLKSVSEYKNSPQAFHSSITTSRTENVYSPKLQWIQHTLRLQGASKPRLIEVATPPSPFTALLKGSSSFTDVESVPALSISNGNVPEGSADAAVLLESLDHVPDPAALLTSVRRRLTSGGLVFITALVSSGFDVAVLGLRNMYVYPPDRTNCFSIAGLVSLLQRTGFSPVEVSTPGVLDVEIVQAHLKHDPDLHISEFERQIVTADGERREAFQIFLQENLMSSFARIVGRVA